MKAEGDGGEVPCKPQPWAWLRTLSLIAMIAFLYDAAARIGLLFALQNTNATPIWPPAGVALAALLVFGWRVSAQPLLEVPYRCIAQHLVLLSVVFG